MAFRVAIVAKDPEKDPEHETPFTYRGAVDDRSAAEQLLRVARDTYPARSYDAQIEELVIELDQDGEPKGSEWVAVEDTDDGGDT